MPNGEFEVPGLVVTSCRGSSCRSSVTKYETEQSARSEPKLPRRQCRLYILANDEPTASRLYIESAAPRRYESAMTGLRVTTLLSMGTRARALMATALIWLRGGIGLQPNAQPSALRLRPLPIAERASRGRPCGLASPPKIRLHAHRRKRKAPSRICPPASQRGSAWT